MLSERIGFASRVSALTAIFVAVIMVGAPSVQIFDSDVPLDAVGNAAAAPEDYTFSVGVIDYIGSMSTVNPFLYTMSAEWETIWPCYSTLVMYKLDGSGFIGDLATSWSVDSTGTSWHFELYDNAFFYDKRETTQTHQVTAADVMYSYWAVQNDTKNHLHSYFPEVGDPLMPLIQSMTSVGDFDLYIETYVPFAPFLGALATIPIVPAYYWGGSDPMNFNNDLIIGSGPFYYGLDGIPEIEGVLHRNPIWFQEELRGWQIHTGTLKYKNYLSAEAAWAALTLDDPVIDVMMEVTPSQYIKLLPDEPDIIGYASSTGFVYELNLNQLSDDLRSELGGNWNTGENNQLLLDPVVKEAIAMCVDKPSFVADVLEGLGSVADSLVPDVNPWHYTYGSIPGETPVQFDPAQARDMLVTAGWAFDSDGNSATSTTVPLCREGGTDPLSFRFYTLTPEPEWLDGAVMIVSACADAGVELNLEMKSSNEMNNAWANGDYDMWLWDWIFTPLSEPDVDILSVCTTSEIGSWSDVYYSNATYDALYARSIEAADPDVRRALCDEMQRMLYEDFGCQCVAYRKELYAASEAYWTNYGDWNSYFMLMPDQALPWLYMRISPVDNEAPVVQVDPLYEGEVDVATTFSASISDTSSLEYKWFWGDGTDSGWISGTSGAADNTYTSDGMYVAYVAAREVGGDGFITWNQTNILILDMQNNAPHAAPGYEDDPITYTPADPDMGDVITFTSHFVDDEDDELFYTWNFGDAYSAVGASAEHQYTSADTFSVTLSVTDNHYGSGERPVVVGTLVNVAVNTVPAIDVPDYPNVLKQESTTFTVTASDDDPLRFTWSWGDGDTTVTTVPTADHTYAVQGTYTLTVFADDLTGLSGHNVSDTGVVNVKRTNTAPVIDSYTVSTTSAATGELITFSGTARDAEGDPLRFTFYFDDGTFAVFNNGATLPDTAVTFSVDKAYSSAATFNTYLYVSDFIINESSLLNAITVVANDPPIVTALSDKDGTEGVSMSFSASAVDPDGDPLTYYWHFGDGTYASGQSVTHAYAVRGEYDFAVYVDDGNGHNETVGATAYVTAVPVLTPLEDQLITEGVVWTFEASATDADGDTITYTWDFGDGSPLEVGQTVTHAYPITGVDTDYDFWVWADDGSPLAGHNVSDTATATVYAIGVNHPPTVGTLADVYGVVDVEVTFTITASDPDGDPLTITWDFGDGTVLVGASSVTHTYVSSNDYSVTVWVDDESGDPDTNVSRTAVAYISEDAVPVADAGPDQDVDEDTTVTFDGSGSSDDVGIDNYAWTIVELSVTLADEVSPTYEFPEPGVYTIELVVTDTIAQDSTPDTMVVTVLDVTDPIADAGPDQTDDYGVAITFDGSGSSDNVGIDNYTWVVNDDGIIELYDVDPSYVFSSPGEYTVRLFVTDDAGNSASDEVIITVVDSEMPVADAGPDQTVDMGDTVTFDGSGSSDNSGIAEYVWTFDYDGVPETRYGVGPVFTFEIPGIYDVTLTVTDLGTNVDTDTVQITVLDTEDPVADADVDQTVMVGAAVTFDGSGSSDNVGIISYAWTFDYDGATETLPGVGPTFTFDIAGDYTVTLTVEDAAGNSAQDTVVITVEAPNEAPVADAGVDQIVTVGATVTFDGSGSSDADGAIENYTWEFTYDAVPKDLYGVAPTFDFDIVGTYTVTLTVTDDDGATDTDEMTVTVQEAAPTNDAPVADAGLAQTVTAGDEVTFDGSGSSDSDGTIENYTWTFTYDGETVTLYAVSPTFDFDIVGTYTVTLTVTDDDGDTDTDTMTVTVEEEDDEKSFLEAYGLPIGIVLALIVAALVAFFVMKGRKGGKAPESAGMDEPTSEAPEEASQEEPPAPTADGQ